MKYEEKEEAYYSNLRLDLLTLIPKGVSNLKILEIGAGYGATLSFLKKNGIASKVIGVDIPQNKGKSPFNNIDKFIYGDIEDLNLGEYEKYFDYIILADVLEHLIYPEEVLKKLKELLKNDGKLLISIPNFRHKNAIYKVFFKGDFSYEDHGLFDYTHMRFFCKKNMIQLVENSGFLINNNISSLKTYKGFSLSKLLNIITFRVFEQFLTVQYLIKASKK